MKFFSYINPLAVHANLASFPTLSVFFLIRQLSSVRFPAAPPPSFRIFPTPVRPLPALGNPFFLWPPSSSRRFRLGLFVLVFLLVDSPQVILVSRIHFPYSDFFRS